MGTRGNVDYSPQIANPVITNVHTKLANKDEQIARLEARVSHRDEEIKDLKAALKGARRSSTMNKTKFLIARKNLQFHLDRAKEVHRDVMSQYFGLKDKLNRSLHEEKSSIRQIHSLRKMNQHLVDEQKNLDDINRAVHGKKLALVRKVPYQPELPLAAHGDAKLFEFMTDKHEV